MVTMEQIRTVSRQMAREFRPHQIVLFGSYAQGKATKDSDVDLLVVLPFKGNPVHKSVQIRMKIRPPFPMDLLVRTPKTIRERVAMGDSFVQDILQNGKVLYEANHS